MGNAAISWLRGACRACGEYEFITRGMRDDAVLARLHTAQSARELCASLSEDELVVYRRLVLMQKLHAVEEHWRSGRSQTSFDIQSRFEVFDAVIDTIDREMHGRCRTL